MALPPIVVFDLDGTLADTAPDLMGTLNVILSREGLPELPLDKARSLIGAGAKALLKRGFAENGRDLPVARLDALFGDFLDHYRANIAVGSRLFDGVGAALDRLEAAGCIFAVCTNKREEFALSLLEALDARHRFRFIAGQDTFDVFKPEPRHLTETIVRAGGDPLRALMVGDSRTDVDTARAARLPVVGVSFGYTDTPMAELSPDALIHHFDDLAEVVLPLLRLA
ncbi:MAG: HAD hydrolase-like protein [Beijerinckiaceae bacterium]